MTALTGCLLTDAVHRRSGSPSITAGGAFLRLRRYYYHLRRAPGQQIHFPGQPLIDAAFGSNTLRLPSKDLLAETPMMGSCGESSLGGRRFNEPIARWAYDLPGVPTLKMGIGPRRAGLNVLDDRRRDSGSD